MHSLMMSRPGDNSRREGTGQQSVRGLAHEEYSEEAYLDYENIDEVDDEQNITQQEPEDMGKFCQQLMEARPTTALVGP